VSFYFSLYLLLFSKYEREVVRIPYTALRINILTGSILWKTGEYFSDAQKVRVSISKALLAVRLQTSKIHCNCHKAETIYRKSDL
jgi:hypothetical protein